MTPRNVPAKDDSDVKDTPASPDKESETAKLNRLLGAVMRYLSDDEQEEIDIEYLLENTEGLRDWWSEYRELDRKRVEEEIKNSLTDLSLEELENIREQIRTKA
jgi:predicted house-cleaning noncanonical NTP pyrophosphatase (MazG superfamily)